MLDTGTSRRRGKRSSGRRSKNGLYRRLKRRQAPSGPVSKQEAVADKQIGIEAGIRGTTAGTQQNHAHQVTPLRKHLQDRRYSPLKSVSKAGQKAHPTASKYHSATEDEPPSPKQTSAPIKMCRLAHVPGLRDGTRNCGSLPDNVPSVRAIPKRDPGRVRNES